MGTKCCESGAPDSGRVPTQQGRNSFRERLRISRLCGQTMQFSFTVRGMRLWGLRTGDAWSVHSKYGWYEVHCLGVNESQPVRWARRSGLLIIDHSSWFLDMHVSSRNCRFSVMSLDKHW